jgi:hypothetical protein
MPFHGLLESHLFSLHYFKDLIQGNRHAIARTGTTCKATKAPTLITRRRQHNGVTLWLEAKNVLEPEQPAGLVQCLNTLFFERNVVNLTAPTLRETVL